MLTLDPPCWLELRGIGSIIYGCGADVDYYGTGDPRVVELGGVITVHVMRNECSVR